jgi:hypothetical protein
VGRDDRRDIAPECNDDHFQSAGLPLCLSVPGINLVLFLALNGYLLGRGYFEVVALRRLDAAAATALRHRHGGRVFLGGVATTGMSALPLVILVAPVSRGLDDACDRSVAAGCAGAGGPVCGLGLFATMSSGFPTHVQPQAKRDRGP